MRNLAQYPLDDNDRLAVLRRLRDEHKVEDAPIGDMTLVVLDDLIKSIESKTDA